MIKTKKLGFEKIMKTKSHYFKLKLSLIVSILLLIFVADKIPLSFDPNLQTVKLDNIQLSNINLVSPVFINDTDPNFNWSKTADENDWCSGSGSWSDPYVIKDITINGNNTSSCIEIRNSNKYFAVKNCTVYNSSTGQIFAGISLENVNNSLIFDNNCSYNNGNGIRLINTYNNTVLDNFAKNNTEGGIYLMYSANNTVRNNNIGNNHRGIVVSYCGANILIDNNSVYGHTEDFPTTSTGIDISFSHNSTITNNNMFNNYNGIFFMSTSNITLKGNNISIGRSGTHMGLSNINLKFVDNIISNCDSGMLLSSIQYSIVRNNTILSCDDGIDIHDIANISVYDNNLINCSSAGIKLGGNSFNITVTRNNFSNCEIYVAANIYQISMLNITKSNLINGKPVYFYTNKSGLTANNFTNPGQIILFNCNNSLISNFALRGGINLILCKNNTITDNIVQANYYGIHLRYCDNNTVFNNTVFGKEYGIYLDMSVNCNITKNNVENSDSYGINLRFSYNNSLHENTMDNNQGGLVVFLSSENNITQNSVKNNSLLGIAVLGSSSYNNIFFNDLIGNSLYGIHLVGASNNTIFGNRIVNSSEIGIQIWTSTDDNIIYNNSFIGNTLNAQDNGTNNQWDNGVFGNFWDDYNGDDINLDGIGDTPYNISGLANSVDSFPQIIRFPPQIIIENPLDSAYFSYNPPEIELTIISPYNDVDTIWYSLINETYTTNNYNFTGEIGQSIWDSLGNGTVTIKFYANNSYGLMGSSEVSVWKDIILPQIVIHNPIENQEFANDTPFYNITILEPNLESVWYTIDNGINNYTITSLTGTITQITWDAAPDGPVTIRFYARDNVGNIGTSSVIVAKSPSDPPTPPPEIPGYNLIIIIGIVSVISLVLAKKRFMK